MESEEHFWVSSWIHSYFPVNESKNIFFHLSCRTSGRHELVQPVSYQLGLKLRGFAASAGSAVADHCRLISSSRVVLGKWAHHDLTSISTYCRNSCRLQRLIKLKEMAFNYFIMGIAQSINLWKRVVGLFEILVFFYTGRLHPKQGSDFIMKCSFSATGEALSVFCCEARFSYMKADISIK